MSKNLYYSNTRSNSKPFAYAAFDTETDGLGGDLLCITACRETDTPLFFSGPCMVRDFLSVAFDFNYTKKNKQVWVSYNLSYDLRYIIEYVLQHREDYALGDLGLRTDTDFYCFEVIEKETDKKIHFIDAMAVFPGSLKSFAAQFGGEYQKLEGPDFGSGVRFDVDNLEHQQYAMMDAQALLASIRAYGAAVERDYGISLGYTAAGTALRAWQATIPDKVAYFRQSRPAREFVRRAYYGGLVFLTDTVPCAGAVTFDINSSYPAQMRKGVPDGKAAQVYDYITPDKRPGFWECEVFAPDDLVVPILAWRDSKNILHWTGGHFWGVYSNIEIEFARQHGYRIITKTGYAFPKLVFPFQEFVDKSERIRKENRKTPRETVAKLMQNSLYGKFGAREDRLGVIVGNDLESCPGAVPMRPDEPDFPFYTIREDCSDEMLNKIEWAAWITAQARLTLLSVVYALGPDNCLYGDTDSVTVRPSADLFLIPCSDAYGDFKREKVWSEFRALAPKCYAGVIADEVTGRSKGQRKKSMSEDDWRALFDSGHCVIETFQLQSIMNSLKNGRKEARSIMKQSSDLRKCASFELREGGKVRPRCVSSLKEGE